MNSRRKLLTFFGLIGAVAVLVGVILITVMITLPVKVNFSVESNIIKTLTVSKNKKVSQNQIPLPTIEGYDFDDWYYNIDFSEKADFNKKINKDTTVYAKFNPKNISIRVFYNDGTNKFYDIPSKHNSIVNLYKPELETSQNNTNYVLAGFKTSLNSTVFYGLDDQITVKGNSFFYAHWIGIPQEVKFTITDAELNGVPYTTDETIFVPYNDNYVVNLSAFAGVVNINTKLAIKGVRIKNGNDTVYRQGDVIKNIKSSMILELVFFETMEGNAIEYNTEQPREIYNYGDEITLKMPTVNKTYHDFIGYYTSNITYNQAENHQLIRPMSLPLTLSNPSSGIVYYAIWKPRDIEIVFHKNLDNAINTMDNTMACFKDTLFLTPNAYSSPTHLFAGWAFQADATEYVYVNGGILYVDESIMLRTDGEGKLNLYAVWNAVQVTVKFNKNYGDEAPDIKQFLKNTTVHFMPPQERPGYDFVGWAKDSNHNPGIEGDIEIYNSSNPYSLTESDEYFYAIWLGRPVTITFNTNDAVIGGIIESITTLRVGDEFRVELYKLKEYRNAIGAAPSGFIIIGGDGRLYEDGDVINITGDLLLKLEFLTPEDMGHINYNDGTAIVNLNPSDPFDDTDVYELAYRTKQYYTLLGYCNYNIDYSRWSEAGLNTYAAGDLVKIEKSVTFYAIWEPVDITIKYVANLTARVEGVIGETTLKFGESFRLPANSSYTAIGWHVTGWALTSSATTADYSEAHLLTVNNGITTFVQTSEKSYDLFIYAIWDITYVVITFDYNGGSGSITTKELQQGAEVFLTDPSYLAGAKEHYDPFGWADMPSAEQTDNISSQENGRRFIVPNTDATIFMLWTPKTYTVTIDTSLARKDGQHFSLPSQNVVYNNYFTITQELYTNIAKYDSLPVKGFTVRGDYSGKIYDLDANQVLIENTTVLEYVFYKYDECIIVNYNYFGGGEGDTFQAFLESEGAKLDSRTNAFYTLVGFKIELPKDDIENRMYFVGEFVNAPAGTVFMAIWEISQIELKFNSGIYPASDTIPSIYFYPDEFVVLPSCTFNLIGSKFRFLHWSDMPEKWWGNSFHEDEYFYIDINWLYNYGNPKDNSVTLYAIWDDGTTTFEFDLNGYNFEDYRWPEPISLAAGQSVELPVWTASSEYNGKVTFMGWMLEKPELSYISGSTLYCEESDSWNRLIAMWHVEPLKVTFDFSNGTGQTYTAEYNGQDVFALPNQHDIGASYGNFEIIGWHDFDLAALTPVGFDYYLKWDDITLYASWATPIDMFYVERDGPYNYGIYFNDPFYTGEVIIPEYYIDESLPYYDRIRYFSYIGDRAFAECNGITKITVPITISEIRPNAFVNCTNLTEFIIPTNDPTDEYLSTNLTIIDDSAFAGCSNLVVFGDNVRKLYLGNLNTIGVAAFAGCEQLKLDLGFAYNLYSIGEFAFFGCTSFDEIILFNSYNLNIIGYGAFAGCHSNIYVNFNDKRELWVTGWDGNCTVYWNSWWDVWNQ